MTVRAPSVHSVPALLAAAVLAGPAFAQEGEPAGRKPAALVKVGSPVDEAVVGAVQNAALKLQREAEEGGERGVLVLELTPGSSRFGPVRDLAQFLTSADLSDVRTVAWVPESVDGNNALLALACEEIVMHPDAELGDLGRGRPLEKADEAFAVALAEKRHNRLVSPALVRGLSDPGRAVLKVTLGEGAGAETRLVGPDELNRLRDEAPGEVKVERVKEEGVPGRFSGERARALGVLAAATAESRQGVARLYDLPELRTAAAAGGVPRVAYILVEEAIEPIIGEFVKRQIDRSVAGGADLIVFELTSPGGSLVTGQDLASRIAELDEKNVRTVAFIPREAFGTAAMIALACDEVYMKPGARLGRVDFRADMAEADEDAAKLARQELRFLAERKGRPPAIAEALADQDLEVFAVTNARTGREWFLTDAEIHAAGDEWRRGALVPETRAGEPTVLDADRAAALGLARPPVADQEELRQRLGVPPTVELRPVGKTWMDSLVFWLNTSAAVWFLLFAGAALLYLELHFLTGILGILSVTCFALFFWSQFLGGTAGWLEVTLFFLGLACLGIEIFLIPGFGVFGVTGGLMMLASLVMAMQTFGVGFSTGRMAQSLATLVAAMAGVLAFGIVSNRFLPRMPLFNQMILAPPGFETAVPTLRPDLLEEVERGPLGPRLGDEGVTRTTLRPAGKADLGGDYVDVVSDGPFIDAGVPVRVTRLEGPRVFVREA